MKKEELLKRLSEVAGDMEDFVGDASMLTFLKDFRQIQEKLNDILTDIEEEEDVKEEASEA